MIKKTTNQIIDACLEGVKEYNRLCSGFFGAPGKEGINRKIHFLILLDTLHTKQPEDAFFAIYYFYMSQVSSSRLRNIIEDKLMWILNLYKPYAKIGVYQDSNGILEVRETFHKKVSYLQSKLGIKDDNDIPLINFNKKSNYIVHTI